MNTIKSIIVALTALSLSPFGISAQENHEYTTSVGQFTALQLQDNINVVYRCVADTTGTVAWTSTNPDFDNAFIFTNSGGTLKIQINTEDIDKPGLPIVYIYSDFLNKVLNYSDSDIAVESIAPCPKIEFSQIGNGHILAKGIKATEVYAKVTAGMGNISLAGDCGEATFRMMGTGTIQADGLRADNVRCKILGGGTIGCWPVKTLTVRGIGSTKIYYKGNPEISHKGGGKLFEIE